MTTVRLFIGGVQFGPAIELERAPVYLRFVRRGDDWATLDALDQLSDEPSEGEEVIAATCFHRSQVHVDEVRNGKRWGRWIREADYAFLDPQPNRATLHDMAKWQAWTTAEHRKTVA